MRIDHLNPPDLVFHLPDLLPTKTLRIKDAKRSTESPHDVVPAALASRPPGGWPSPARRVRRFLKSSKIFSIFMPPQFLGWKNKRGVLESEPQKLSGKTGSEPAKVESELPRHFPLTFHCPRGDPFGYLPPFANLVSWLLLTGSIFDWLADS